MDYYRCSVEALHRELERRRFETCGNRDLLCEQLRADDEAKGSEATTVTTANPTAFAPREVSLLRTAEFGHTVPATQLAGQRIIYWNLNTFFPMLQLFFESGLSCTIDGGGLPDAIVDVDPQLRFRLTDCAHEEQGRLTKSVIPAKYARSGSSMRILEATVAQRTSITVRPRAPRDQLSTPNAQGLDIVHETHTVVGLRLNGMTGMGYVWAEVKAPFRQAEGRKWGDVRLAGLRSDVPAPILGLPADLPKPGGELMVVDKSSMIKSPAIAPDGLDRRRGLWV